MAIERTLVQIRERPLLDLLDLALVVVRERPATLALAAAVGIAPFAAINAWLFLVWEDGSAVLALTAWLVEAPLATAPLTFVLGDLMFGQRLSPGKTFRAIARSSFRLVVEHGLLRFVLFFYVPTRLAFANEIILLERARWFKIIGRGGDLASGRAGDLIGLSLLQFFLTYLFATLFFLAATQIRQLFLAEGLSWVFPKSADFSSWKFQLPIWIVVSYFAIVRFLLYIDQRIRLEGWEVEIRLREVGEALEEAHRW